MGFSIIGNIIAQGTGVMSLFIILSKCEELVAEYEDAIEEWFFEFQNNVSLVDYLCRMRMLRNEPSGCLEELVPHPMQGK